MQLFRIINIIPTTNVDQRVKRMSDQEVVTLDGIGITTKDDLRYVEFVDLANTIPVIKRRKLNIIGQYLAKGHALNANITMGEVLQTLCAPAAPGGLAPAQPLDPDRGAPKVRTDPLPEFPGDALAYEE